MRVISTKVTFIIISRPRVSFIGFSTVDGLWEHSVSFELPPEMSCREARGTRDSGMNVYAFITVYV